MRQQSTDGQRLDTAVEVLNNFLQIYLLCNQFKYDFHYCIFCHEEQCCTAVSTLPFTVQTNADVAWTYINQLKNVG